MRCYALEQLGFTQLTKKLSAFYETRLFIIVFITICSLFLPYTNLPSMPRSSKCSLSVRVTNKNSARISVLFYTYQRSALSRPLHFVIRIEFGEEYKIMKPLRMQFFPFSCPPPPPSSFQIFFLGQEQALVNAVTNLRVSQNAGNFFTEEPSASQEGLLLS